MNTPLYKLRFFFDAGSGICFWTANDSAKDKFEDYPVENNKLPIPENLWRRLNYLCSWYDTCIDWDYPPDPSPWSENEALRFNLEVEETLLQVITKLGSEFQILNEHHT